MRVLVVGASGMLGRKLVEVLGTDHEVCAATRDGSAAFVCDLAETASIDELVSSASVDHVVNAAAFTAVDRCETEADLAFRINAEAPGELAAACARHNVGFTHFSTDYVFDGLSQRPYIESDATGPRSVYGKTKLEGELRVRKAHSEAMILRVQWLYGEHGPNFAETMLRLASEHPRLKVVDDQFGAPTYTGDVARQYAHMLNADLQGTYHVTNQGETSWHGFASAVIAKSSHADVPVDACGTDEFPRPAPRPKYSVLENRALSESIGDTMPPWMDGLDQFMLNRAQTHTGAVSAQKKEN